MMGELIAALSSHQDEQQNAQRADRAPCNVGTDAAAGGGVALIVPDCPAKLVGELTPIIPLRFRDDVPSTGNAP
jgi:hypothetical protein